MLVSATGPSVAGGGGLLAANNLSDLANKQTAVDNLTNDAAVIHVKLASTATEGFQVYNTVDQTTNYERLEILFVSNLATIRTVKGGTGTVRDIVLGPIGGTVGKVRIGPDGSAAVPSLTFADNTNFGLWLHNSAGNALGLATGTNTQTSGPCFGVVITPIYNQASGNAANTDLLINRTQTAVGSGTQLLIDAQVGGSSKFSVSNQGAVTFVGNLIIGGGGVATIFDSSPSARIAWTATANTYTAGTTSGAGADHTFTGSTYTGGAGIAQVGVQVTNTINQTSTASFTDLLVSRTQTAAGSGTQLLIDCQVGGTSQWALGNNGRQTRYSGVTLAGWGSPAIYASGRSTAQTAAVGTVTSYTVGAADGSFEVLANVLVTTATTHNFTVTCAYTDEGNTARTLTLNFSVVAGTIGTTIVNTGGAVPYEGVPLRIRAKAATTITIATVGTFTSVTYNVEASILQLA